MFEESPIFDRLASERNYANLISDEPQETAGSPFMRSGMKSLGISSEEATRGIRALGKLITESTKSKTEPEHHCIAENIHPLTLINKGIEFQKYTTDLIMRFKKENPDVKLSHIKVQTKEEFDGTVTVLVMESDEPVYDLTASWPHSAYAIRDASTLPAFLNAKAQTDESVNAAPNSISFVKRSVEDEPEYLVGDPVSQLIVDAQGKFLKEHPNAVINSMTPKVKEDGSIIVEIEAAEPNPLDRERYWFLKNVAAARMVEQEAEILNPGSFRDVYAEAVDEMNRLHAAQFAKEFNEALFGRGEDSEETPEHIGEDEPDSLYMKPYTRGSDEE